MRKIRGNVVGTPQRPEAALLAAAGLTEEMKAQARANIGAAGVDDIPEMPENIGGIPIDTAEVGQTIAVKAVDENGKPTEWEAADLPSGGGGAEWKLLANATLEEDVAILNINTDMNGKTFSELELSELFIRYKLVGHGTDGYTSRYSDLSLWFNGGGTPGGYDAAFTGLGNGQSGTQGTIHAIYPSELESTKVARYGLALHNSGIAKSFQPAGKLASATIKTTAGLKAGSQFIVYGR